MACFDSFGGLAVPVASLLPWGGSGVRGVLLGRVFGNASMYSHASMLRRYVFVTSQLEPNIHAGAATSPWTKAIMVATTSQVSPGQQQTK